MSDENYKIIENTIDSMQYKMTELEVYEYTKRAETVVLCMAFVAVVAINLAVWFPSVMAFVSLAVSGFLWSFSIRQLRFVYDNIYDCEDSNDR